MLADVLIWGGYIALFIWLSRKGSGHDVMVSGRVGFGIQAFAYVATYISAVALVGFGGLAYAYGMQMLLVAAGNVWLGTWIVYRYLAWPTRLCQRNLQARTPVQLLANGHRSPLLGRCLALVFAVFLGVYASAVIKGAALLLAQIMPVPVWLLVWIVALLVAAAIYMGGLRGVLYTEAMQGFVMLVGICMLTVAVFDKVGGPLEGMARLAELADVITPNLTEALLLLGGEEVAQRQFVAPFERIGVRRGVVEVVGAAQIARAGDGVDEQRVDPCGGRLDRVAVAGRLVARKHRAVGELLNGRAHRLAGRAGEALQLEEVGDVGLLDGLQRRRAVGLLQREEAVLDVVLRGARVHERVERQRLEAGFALLRGAGPQHERQEQQGEDAGSFHREKVFSREAPFCSFLKSKIRQLGR